LDQPPPRYVDPDAKVGIGHIHLGGRVPEEFSIDNDWIPPFILALVFDPEEVQRIRQNDVKRYTGVFPLVQVEPQDELCLM
jgi:hypothetical protein